mmetsp:Transcript_20601/g.48885  ORF Transcript_20601/g.48885 Transcript_20601/m.48885 type:complete len:97 (-) Transcript_20601:716-1006(-)
MCVEHLSRNFYRCSSNAIHCREPIGHIGSVDCSDSVDSGKPIDSGNFGTWDFGDGHADLFRAMGKITGSAFCAPAFHVELAHCCLYFTGTTGALAL